MNVRQNQLYKKQRKIVIANNDICGVCGFPVDKKQPYNIKADGVSIVNPISATVDHIVPIAKGGSVLSPLAGVILKKLKVLSQ